jgi:integral membrane protein
MTTGDSVNQYGAGQDGTSQERATRGALTRYRVMAFVTGTLLLIVTVNVVLKYVVGVDNEQYLEIASIIAIVHGWVFVVYAATCLHLWMRMKWRLGRLATMVAGGVVPVMSFVVERTVRREVLARLAA